MKEQKLIAADGASFALYTWSPAGPPRAVMQIVHGMAEHAARYTELAQALNAAGYVVYAHDQRGHGRTAGSQERLGRFETPGIWRRLLDDIAFVRCQIAADFPGMPLFLLGHSMGSFLAQQAAAENTGAQAGLVLSGTYFEPRVRARAGALLARLERWRLGPDGRSKVIRAMTFDSYARRFKPARTRFDWLSRDAGAVDLYVHDPLCGFDLSVQLWVELLDRLAAHLPLPSLDLPICLLSGEADPVASLDVGASRLLHRFHRAGLHRVAQCVYPGARHELFHETNRSEVIADLVAWLEQFVPRG